MIRSARVVPLLLLCVSCGGDSDLSRLALRDTASVIDPTSGLREFRDCPECPTMVELPRGRFLMGAAPGETELTKRLGQPEASSDAERPQVDVEIARRIAIGKYEVSFAEWDYCYQQGGCTYRPQDEGWGRGERPVINVTRLDAEEYVRWLRGHTGVSYRLPSEAEWEYAARGGSTTARHWGDSLGEGRAVCDGCGSRWDGRRTAPVGSLEPNAFGLHDVLGNATEWVADCWHPTHDGAPGNGAARTSDSPWWRDGECERPVRRGGFWQSYPWTVRAAHRTYWRPGPWSERSPHYGFRVARDL